MNLRTICGKIKDTLQDNAERLECPAESIDYGKLEMPSEAPFVWIFPQPQDVPEPADDIRRMEIAIFCGKSGADFGDCMFNSLELAEEVMLVISENMPGVFNFHYTFDTNYGNYSVAILFATFDYIVEGIG